MTTRNDVNTPMIAIIGFLSALLLFAAVILLQVMFYRIQARDRYHKDFGQPMRELTDLRHQQQARLSEYRWIDEKQKIAAIPIDRAMDLVVAELAKKAEPAGAKDNKEKPR